MKGSNNSIHGFLSQATIDLNDGFIRYGSTMDSSHTSDTTFLFINFNDLKYSPKYLKKYFNGHAVSLFSNVFVFQIASLFKSNKILKSYKNLLITCFSQIWR